MEERAGLCDVISYEIKDDIYCVHYYVNNPLYSEVIALLFTKRRNIRTLTNKVSYCVCTSHYMRFSLFC